MCRVKEPPCEDNEAEAEQRRRQAEAAAVDLSWLAKESQKPYLVRPNLKLFTRKAVLSHFTATQVGEEINTCSHRGVPPRR